MKFNYYGYVLLKKYIKACKNKEELTKLWVRMPGRYESCSETEYGIKIWSEYDIRRNTFINEWPPHDPREGPLK